MRVLQSLEKSRNFWFLLVASVFFFLLRFPSLFEPYWYGDEGVYQVLGLAMQNGRLLYRDIWDNKPPLLYIIYSALGSDQFAVRLLSLIFGIGSIIVFFYLSKKIFNSSKISIFTTSLFVLLFGLPFLEGNIANAENFMLFPILGSAYLLFSLKKDNDVKNRAKNIRLTLLSGLLLGIAFLFKIVAIFDFGAFLFFLLFSDESILEHLKNKRYRVYEVQKVISFVVGFLILPIIVSLYFLLNGAFSQYISAIFFSNIGYVVYGNDLVVPQGLLLFKIFLLFLFSYFLFKRRKNINPAVIFVLLWFAFSLFNAFFSQRPYSHYLLVIIPSFCILLGIILEDKKFQKLNIALLFLSLILVFNNFTFYAKVLPYYRNFISFVAGEKSVADYQRFFDRITPVDYELSLFVKSHTKPDDSIFIWGNNAQLYKLADKLPPGKYTVAYHITGIKNGIKETTKDIATRKPKLIIVMPYMKYFPFQLSNYLQKISIDEVSIYERAL